MAGIYFIPAIFCIPQLLFSVMYLNEEKSNLCDELCENMKNLKLFLLKKMRSMVAHCRLLRQAALNGCKQHLQVKWLGNERIRTIIAKGF